MVCKLVKKTVYVGEFIPRDGRSPTEITNFTNLYIKNFPEDWDEEKLLEEFKKFGVVTSSMFQKDKKGRSFCFLNYETPEEARAAIDTWHMKDMRSEEAKKEFPDGPPKAEDDTTVPADDHPDHLMYVARAQSKAEREAALKAKFAKPATASETPEGSPTDSQQGVNLYIKNLADDVTDVTLKEMFVQFGEITSARVMCDPKGRSKGFGFVCYKTPDEATKAVTEMHLKVVKGKPLYVGLAEKKEDRTSRLAQRYKGEKGMGVAGKGGLITYDQAGGKGQMAMQPAAMQPQVMMQPGKGQQPLMNPMYPQQQLMGAMQPAMMGQQQVGGKGTIFPQQQMFGQAGGMLPMQMQQLQQQQLQQQLRPQMQQGMQPQRPGMPGMQPGMPMQPGKGQMMGMQPGQVKGQQMQQGGKGQQLSAQMLANAPPGMQKQMLGEKLYPAVSRLQPELAGKITGMMLEMDNNELLMMLESETQLRQKVDEALRVLQGMQNK